jgi:aminoglycoside phosphotransferase (APT) family kinase protein
MSVVEPIAFERLQTSGSRHPAVQAWHQLAAGAAVRGEISILKERVKSTIYLLPRVGPASAPIVAKYCRRATAAHERTIYEQILPYLPVSSPAYHGFVRGSGEYDWLFLEYVEGEKYSRDRKDHSQLAARWLGLLHKSSLRVTPSPQLPYRGLDHYLDHLRSARTRFLDILENLDLPAPASVILEAVISQCNFLDSRWKQIEKWCDIVPRTLIHGDFKPKNIVIRTDANGSVFLPYDWEMSCWGTPAVDLAYVDLDIYHSVVKDCWQDLDIDNLRKVAVAGKILRRLCAFDWESEKLDPRWELSMEHMDLYRTFMAKAIQEAPWEDKPKLEQVGAELRVPKQMFARHEGRGDSSTSLMAKTLEVALSRSRGRRVCVRELNRKECEATESFHSERLHVELDGGESIRVFLKDLDPAHQTEIARKVREPSLVSGHRELQMYQAILSRLQRLGTPRLYAVRWEPERGIYWLFLEDTGTSRLRECRNFARWIPAAQWAARFHAACRSLAHSLTSFLPVYNEEHYRRCAERVEQILPGLELEDRRLIGQALEHYMGRIEWLSALPRTVIHGQYFGRNIMLRRRNRERMIAVIDWETAALGPGLIDLVSFTSGKWTDEQRRTMWRAYFDQYEAETEVSRDWENFCKELRELELYQALEWLAWWRNRSVSHNFGKWVTELKRITRER